MNRKLLLLPLMAYMPMAAQNNVNKADTLDYMNEDPFNLEQVVVTATRTQKKLKNIPVITQVLSAKQIEERGVSNIQDLLSQEVPGLNFQEVGFGTDIDIQGLGSKHILFLIDGERIAGENGGNIDYSRINLYNVDRIEIVKGASSALYGSQAMGGVINIITRKAKKKFEVSAGVKYAENNQKNFEENPKDHPQYKFRKNADKPNLNGNFSLGLNLGKFTMNTDVLYKSSDGYQLYDKKGLEKYYPEYDLTVKEEANTSPTSISGYEDIHISHKMGYKFNDKLKVNAHGSYYMLNKFDFVADNVFDNTEDFTYGAGAEYSFSKNSVLSASFHADNYHRYKKFELKDGRRLEYKNNIIQPRIVYSNTAIKNQAITAGVEFYSESLYSDKFENNVYQSKSQWYTTTFIQDDWTINNQLSLIAGIRGDYHQEYGVHVTPKVSFMYKVFPFTFRMNYARGYRSPTIKELYMNWDHLGMFWIYGNSDLQPETNNYVSLSGEYVNSWININVNVYGNWFHNKIEGMWKEDQTELHYVNIGKSHLMGAETMCKVRVNKYINLHGAYNYLYTGKDENGVRLNSSSPHSGTFRAEYNTHVNKFATVVNLNGTFMGKKNFDVLDQLTLSDGKEVDAYYKAHVKSYCIWDLTVSQYIMKQLRITAGVNNLFDYTSDRVTFNTSTSPGRKFFVSCNYTL